MKIKYLFLSLLFTISILAQENAVEQGLLSIKEDAIKGQLEFLASDWMQGRETGTEGSYMAADYIVSMFKVYGIMPAGDTETTYPSRADRRRGVRPEEIPTYFQSFSLLQYEAGDNQELKLISDNGNIYSFNYRSDFSVNTGTVGTESTARIVFVGYGYKNDLKEYNDFKGVDVKGKFILRLSGFPGHSDTSSKAYKAFAPTGRYGRWGMMREKNNIAEELGALGVIEVNPDEASELDWADNYPFRYNSDNYEGQERLRPGTMGRMTLPGDSISGSISMITVSNRVANEIIKGTGVSFEKFESTVKNNLKPDSQKLKGKSLYVKTNVKSKIIRARNVLGMIEGENKDEIVIVGAHYDHVGMSKGFIWNGSDDNASGTVGMLSLARAIHETGVKPKRTIIFAAWTGEEKGLQGSRYFASNDKRMPNVMFYLNFDMISRNDDNDTLGNKFEMSYSSEYPLLEANSEKFKEELGLNLDITYDPSKRPGGGSDHASFSAKDVPVAYYFGGFHPDYHGISDHADKADYKKMTSVIKLGFRVIWELANMEHKLTPADNPAK